MDLDKMRQIVARSHSRGMDPIFCLNKRGLLLTDEKRNELVREVARNLADTIELSSASQMGCKGIPRTGLDMQRCIVAFLRQNFGEEKRHG